VDLPQKTERFLKHKSLKAYLNKKSILINRESSKQYGKTEESGQVLGGGCLSSRQLGDLFSELQPLGIAPTTSSVAGFWFPACSSFSICMRCKLPIAS